MRLLACLLAWLPVLGLTASVALATPPQAEARADHVADRECVACHADQARLWAGSKHELAMQPATPDTVVIRHSTTHSLLRHHAYHTPVGQGRFLMMRLPATPQAHPSFVWPPAASGSCQKSRQNKNNLAPESRMRILHCSKITHLGQRRRNIR